MPLVEYLAGTGYDTSSDQMHEFGYDSSGRMTGAITWGTVTETTGSNARTAVGYQYPAVIEDLFGSSPQPIELHQNPIGSLGGSGAKLLKYYFGETASGSHQPRLKNVLYPTGSFQVDVTLLRTPATTTLSNCHG